MAVYDRWTPRDGFGGWSGSGRGAASGEWRRTGIATEHKDMTMTAETRAGKIAAYGRAYETLVAGIAKFPPEMWDFRDECGC